MLCVYCNICNILVFGCNISKQVDWERWSDTLATMIARYHPPWLLLWGYVKNPLELQLKKFVFHVQ